MVNEAKKALVHIIDVNYHYFDKFSSAFFLVDKLDLKKIKKNNLPWGIEPMLSLMDINVSKLTSLLTLRRSFDTRGLLLKWL
jgi:hypothetical protein